MATHKWRIADAARLLVDGVLDRADTEALAGEEQAALGAAETELVRLQRLTLVPVETVADVDDVLAADWQRVLSEVDEPEHVRDILRLLVAFVVPVRIKRAMYRVGITWTPLARRLLEATGAVSVDTAA